MSTLFIIFNLGLCFSFYCIGVLVGIEKCKKGKHSRTMRTYKKF